jgi:hypothetical protein
MHRVPGRAGRGEGHTGSAPTLVQQHSRLAAPAARSAQESPIVPASASKSRSAVVVLSGMSVRRYACDWAKLSPSIRKMLLMSGWPAIVRQVENFRREGAGNKSFLLGLGYASW